ncbi:MAG: DUF1015 domain-containing protein, partial [Anaerotignaceae bacterium]
LHVDRAEVDLPVGTDTHSTIVYEQAANTLMKFINEGTLKKDEKPCLYIYSLTMDKRTQSGIVACTSIDEYLDGTIKKHEFTRKDKEEDRINHVDYCDANTGPIFLAYKQNVKIDEIVGNWQKNNSPVYDFTAEDGIVHTAWVIDNHDTITELTNLFKEVSNLYIADGHHRNASAVAVGLKRREDNKDFTGEEEFNYYLSVLFPSNQLKILDYNRVVKDLNGLTVDEFIERISEDFYILPYSGKGQFAPTMPHQFGMFLMGKWYTLTVDPSIIPNDPVKSLDVSLLQDKLLSPILGIKDPRTDSRIDFVGGIRGLGELEKRVMTGEMAVAFSMYPTSMEELMSVADSGLVMPPKSTWFEPKLRSGLFIHQLK